MQPTLTVPQQTCIHTHICTEDQTLLSTLGDSVASAILQNYVSHFQARDGTF